MADKTDQAVELALLRQEVDALKEAIEKQNEKIEELLAAWQTANGVVGFVKLIGGIAAAVLATVGLYKGFGK